MISLPISENTRFLHEPFFTPQKSEDEFFFKNVGEQRGKNAKHVKGVFFTDSPKVPDGHSGLWTFGVWTFGVEGWGLRTFGVEDVRGYG